MTELQLNSAISRLKANKSAGPDGFPFEWFEVFPEPSLVFGFQYNSKGLKNGPSWSKAVISIMPKEEKDKLEC